jgi:hypothetical protein
MQTPKPRRPIWQWSLRTLFIGLTLASGFLVAGQQLMAAHKREKVRQAIDQGIGHAVRLAGCGGSPEHGRQDLKLLRDSVARCPLLNDSERQKRCAEIDEYIAELEYVIRLKQNRLAECRQSCGSTLPLARDEVAERTADQD